MGNEEATRVLLVESQAALQTVLVDKLSAAGFEVEAVSSAEEALARLGNGSSAPLVVTEVALPTQSGIELSRQLRLKHPDASIIFLSGSDDPRLAAAAMRVGAFDYVLKHLDGPDRLVAAIKAAEAARLEEASRREEQERKLEDEKQRAIARWIEEEEDRRRETDEQRQREEERRRVEEERRRAEEEQRRAQEEEQRHRKELHRKALLRDVTEMSENFARQLENPITPAGEAPGTFKVLVVDDEPSILTVLGDLLSQEGYHVETVLSGEDALERLERDTFDLLLIDKNLPGMSGIQLIRQARESSPKLESVIITGYGSLQSAVEAMELGARAYLLKPFDDISVVLRRVNQIRDEQLERAHAGGGGGGVSVDQRRTELVESHQEIYEKLRELSAD